MPLRTQWSPRSFELVLPAGAVVEGVSAQRPGASSLPTTVKLDPDGPKGHYAINFPIQPDDNEKGTLFQIEYEVPYGEGKFTFHPQVSIPARTVWVVLPKSMTFAAGAGSVFQSAPQDPGFQTYVSRNALPGKALEFTVSGSGSMPREDQGAQGSQATGAPGSQPGGGIGNPIGTPDPLTKYKWWILAGFALLLVAAAAFLLRKQTALTGATLSAQSAASGATTSLHSAAPASRNTALLGILKDELFTLESEKASGTISPGEYAEVKAGLEAVLKRALKRN
jgi:hypothetical protein